MQYKLRGGWLQVQIQYLVESQPAILIGKGQYICRPCRDTLYRNTYSTAAAVIQTEDQSPFRNTHDNISDSPQTSYVVNAGVVLSRPPLITRDLHPFESAFFLYQRRLNERLALPFTRYFYFKENTPADIEWKRKLKQRLTPARDIGRYKGYGDEAWNDEVLVGAPESEVHWQVERLLEDAERTAKEERHKDEDESESKESEKQEDKPVALLPVGGKMIEHEPVERPMPRVTEADLRADVKSLNRMLQRTLYLLVKDRNGQWVFPQDRIAKESLHTVCWIQNQRIQFSIIWSNKSQAAERIIIQSGGINMNTWVVGRVPIGHHQYDFPVKALQTSSNPNELGHKTFFMKARIMAGQIDLKLNKFGLEDYKWLTKEEVEEQVPKDYWKFIKNMLADR